MWLIMFEETRWIGGISMDEKKAPDPVRRDLAYDLLSGYLEGGPASEGIGEERAKVDALVNVIYRHRLKLCNRAGLDFEDKDLLEIISAYDRLNQLVGNFMYDQGWLDATLTQQT